MELPKTNSHSLRLTFVAVAFIGAANAAISAEPPKLVEFVEKAEAARAETIDTPIAEKVAALNKNYASALQRAGTDAQEKGDLEAAILIKSELDRMGAGEPFDLEKEIPLTSATRIVYTYSDVLEKIAAEKKTLETDFAKKVESGLQQLIAELTKSDRLEDALAVKNYAEGDALSKLVKGGGAPVFLVGLPETAVSEPIGVSTDRKGTTRPERILPGDLPPGRIVFLSLTSDTRLPLGFQAAADADMTDIAMVGRTNYGNVGAIRSDGALVYWSGSGEPEIVPGNNISCGQSFGLPLIGLGQSGRLSATSGADAETKAAIEAETKAVHIGMTSGIFAVSRSDGTLDVIGPQDDIENAIRMEQVEGAVQTGFSGPAFATVLKSDGSVSDFVNGEQQNSKPEDPVAKLHGFRLGENERGELLQWGRGGRPMLEDIGEHPRQVFAISTLLAAIAEDGEFFLYRKNNGDSLQRVEGADDALKDANSFAWVGGQGEEWLIVVLPADSVSRSGFWTFEELAAERTSR